MSKPLSEYNRPLSLCLAQFFSVKVEAARYSAMLVAIYQTIRRLQNIRTHKTVLFCVELQSFGPRSERGTLDCDGLTIQHLCVLTHLVDGCERYGAVFWALVEVMGHGLATGWGSDWGTHRQHGAGRYDVHSATHSVCNKQNVVTVFTLVTYTI